MPEEVNDFQSETNVKRIDELETFKKGFEGKELDTKICTAIKDSAPLQEQIKELVWRAIKDKIMWIIGTVIGLLFITFLTRMVTNLADRATQ